MGRNRNRPVSPLEVGDQVPLTPNQWGSPLQSLPSAQTAPSPYGFDEPSFNLDKRYHHGDWSNSRPRTRPYASATGSPSASVGSKTDTQYKFARISSGDSQTALLTPSSETTPYPYAPEISYGGPPAVSHSASVRTTRCPLEQGRWHHWVYRKEWHMYYFLAIAVAFAIGHHFYYSKYDNELVVDQLRIQRYGSVLAFLVKVSLATAVVIAFKQRLWVTVREKSPPIAVVDSLFSLPEDLTSFINREMVKDARVAVLMALYVWLTPLVVILTSDTLTVEPRTTSHETTCPSARTLNFTHEETNDWRHPKYIAGLPEMSLCYWNNTSADTASPSFFDYYDEPSQQFEQVAAMTVYSKRPVTRDHAAIDICGSGWNCSYSISFTGPGYKCAELARGVGAEVAELHGQQAPFDTDRLLPEGNFSYYSVADQGDYVRPQVVSGDGGIPRQPPPYPDDLGAFRTEPVIWMGYSAVEDPSKLQPENQSSPGWDTAFTPVVFACELYETAYEAVFNYTGGIQHTLITKRKFIAPLVDTTLAPELDADDGTLDNTTALPRENYVRPTDVHHYRRVAAYHAIGSLVRRYVDGSIAYNRSITTTLATQSRLVDPHTYLGVHNLMAAVQGLCEDVLLSLFSNPQFLAVSWAADPSRLSGVARSEQDEAHAVPALRYPCLRERTDNRYRYHYRDLWLVYGFSTLVAIGAVAMGRAAMRTNHGRVRQTRVSNILAAAKGRELERVFWEMRSVEDEARGVIKGGYGRLYGWERERERGLGVHMDGGMHDGFSVAEVGR